MKKENLPNKLAVFPLSNFIIFPKTTVPLNIFEKRYIEMINDSMKKDKLIGMIQPKNLKEQENSNPELHESLMSFGFKLLFQEEQEKIFYDIYEHNIIDYKNKPEWLNSDYWANPELWEK